MKNSAWYQKLWLKKLDQLPVKDPDAGWAGMRSLLDQQLPVTVKPVSQPNYWLGTKLIKLFSYLLPAAAIIGTGVYFTLPVAHQTKADKVSKLNIVHADSVKKTKPEYTNPGYTNSVAWQNNVDITNPATGQQINPANKLLAVENPVKKVRSASLKLKQSIITNNIAAHNSPAVYSTGNNIVRANYQSKNDKKGKLSGTSYLIRGNSNNMIRRNTNNLTSVNEKQAAKHNKHPVQKSQSNYRAIGRRRSSSSNNLRTNAAITKRHTHNSTGPANQHLNEVKNSGTQQNAPLSTYNNFLSAALPDGKAKDIQPEPVMLPQDSSKSSQQIKTSISNKTTVQKDTGANASDLAKAKTSKNKPADKPHKDIVSPRYNYGIEAGMNVGMGNNSSFYFGGFGTYALKPRLLVNLGVRINSYRTISGGFTHPAYYGQDSLPPFAVVDTRKLLVINIPITIEYKLFNALSVKAGALINLPFTQSGVSTKLGPVAFPRDTIFHTQQINDALSNTSISNKINVGFTGGISLHIKKFDINGTYQILEPYKISNSLGDYSKAYQTFQIGLGFRFR